MNLFSLAYNPLLVHYNTCMMDLEINCFQDHYLVFYMSLLLTIEKDHICIYL